MSKELTAPLSQGLSSRSKAEYWLRRVGVAMAGSALVAACAHIALPLYFTPVPLTVGDFAVLVLGLTLSPRLAAATLAAYLMEGAVGLPVFAPGPLLAPAGLAHLLGPTGGYLLSYPFAAALVSFLFRRGRRRFSSALVSAAIGNLFLLICGALWFAFFTHAATGFILAQTIVPFLPGSALKVALAAAVAAGSVRLSRRLSQIDSQCG